MALGLGINHSVTDYALGWEPTDNNPSIGTIKLFLKNDTNISTNAWLDEVDSNGDFIQNELGRQASLSGGGLNFDGVDDVYEREETLIFYDNAPLTIAFVFSPSEDLTGQNIFESEEVNSRISITNSGGNSILHFEAEGLVTTFAWGKTINTGKQYIIILKSENGSMIAYHNQYGDAGVENPTNENLFGVKTMGFGNSRYFPGIIYEVFMISGSPINSNYYNSIKDYLNYKFNLIGA